MSSSFHFLSLIDEPPNAGQLWSSQSANFNAAHEQTILAMITSARSRWPSDVATQGWREAGLNAPCKVRFKLFTLDDALIVRKVGHVIAKGRQSGEKRAFLAFWQPTDSVSLLPLGCIGQPDAGLLGRADGHRPGLFSKPLVPHAQAILSWRDVADAEPAGGVRYRGIGMVGDNDMRPHPGMQHITINQYMPRLRKTVSFL